MSADRLLSVEEARRAVFAAIAGPTPAEVAWLIEARGRVVAETVTSPIALPPWDNSAMDGYAIRAADVAGATEDGPARLEVIGEVRAGQAPEVTVRRGSAVRIATGAPVPPGADAVVPVEETTPLDDAGAPAGPRGRDATGPLPAGILVHTATPVGGSIRRAGSDLAAGTPILDPGTVLTPAALGLAAGVGLDQLNVHRRPIVGILATGDEVRSPGSDLGPAGIPDANGPGLVALVEAAGGDPRVLGIAKDRLDDVKSRICAGLIEGADALIVSGGVSVGPYDVVRAAFEAFGTVDLWRVAVQPGKPFAFGTGRAPGDDADERPARDPAVRPAGQPGLDLRHLRAVRPAGHPSPRRAPRRRPLPPDRSRRPERPGHEEQRPARLRPGDRGARRGRHSPARRSRPRPGEPGRRRRWTGESRAVGAGHGRRPGGHPRVRRQPAGRCRGRALVARPRLTRSRAMVTPAILGS